MLSIWSIAGNSVVHSWPPNAMNGPVAKINIFFLFEQLRSSNGEIWFPNREQRNVFQAIFVLSPRNISFIFVNNAKLVHRRKTYAMCICATESIKFHQSVASLNKTRVFRS
jgi:hypothetical protein